MSKTLSTTFNDANQKFCEVYPKKLQVISVINRFILTELGLVIKGSRMTKKEKIMASKMASNLFLKDFDRDQLEGLIIRSFNKQKTSKKLQKSAKSHLNFYLNFLENYFDFAPNNSKNLEKICQDTSPYRINKKPTRYIEKSHLNLSKKRKPKVPISLKLNSEHYLASYQAKNPDSDIEDLKKIISEKLTIIENKLKEFETYCLLEIPVAPSTSKNHQENIKRLLGWLYLQDTDLEKVSFEEIIPVVELNLKISDFDSFREYTIAKIRSEELAKEQAKKTRKFLDNFFQSYQVTNNETQQKYIQVLIALAKYLYKDITDEDEVEKFDDIAVIRNLRHYRRKLKRINPPPHKIKTLKFTWNEILIIREQLKKEADLEFSFSNRQKRGVVEKKERGKKAIAKSKMRFLVFCLFTIIPPDRARTIRELRIGETLKHGIKTNEGFISREQLSNSSTAKYYIHLQDKDYKTGQIYGEFWGEIPNHIFRDGSKFYDYLTDWIYGGWRKVLLKNETHNYCFCKSEKSVPHTVDSFHSLVAKAFRSKTGIKMGTHALRDIFCTYLEEIDAPAEVRASAAYWMKHSEQIAKKVYTVVDLQTKLTPAFEFMKQLNS